jgi:hypothetical protein
LACQDESFVNNPLNVKGNDEHTHDFSLSLSRLFRSAMKRTCRSNTRVRLMLPSPNASLIISRVSVALFPRFSQNVMHIHCWIHREFCTLTPKIC